MHRTPWEARCFTGTTTLSPAKPTPGCASLTQKRVLFQGPAPTSPVSLRCRHLAAMESPVGNPIYSWDSLYRAYVESNRLWTTVIHFDKPEVHELRSDHTQSTFRLSWDQYTGHNERTLLWIFYYKKRLKHNTIFSVTKLALFSTNRPALQPRLLTIMPMMMKKLSYRNFANRSRVSCAHSTSRVWLSCSVVKKLWQ